MATISGGEKLKARLAEILKNAHGAKAVNVGFLPNARYPDGTQVAMVAALNEYGVPSHNQPPRPFFRNMIAAKKDGWGDTLASLLKAHNYDGKQSLSLMGEGIKGQLQTSIQEFSTPVLAPSTKKAKGFDKPLIDTSHMANSVDFEVKE